jgi:hypothetical protein
MEARIWRVLYSIVWEVAARRPPGGRRFPDAVIVITLLWAAFSNRPILWATQRRNWPVWMQRWFERVPTPTTMSRRLRSESVRALLDAVLARAQDRLPASLCIVIDGKPLVIGGGSKDRQAGYGRAVGGKAKGYKLHAIMNLHGRILAWRVSPMNTSEQTMAARLLRQVEHSGYALSDGNYDSNELHAQVNRAGMQLVAPRRRPFTGLGHHRQRPGRLRSIELTESGSDFARHLDSLRDTVERQFGNMTSFGAGLGPLPAWVRTHRRVRLWVHAKLIINAVRLDCRLAA